MFSRKISMLNIPFKRCLPLKSTLIKMSSRYLILKEFFSPYYEKVHIWSVVCTFISNIVVHLSDGPCVHKKMIYKPKMNSNLWESGHSKIILHIHRVLLPLIVDWVCG